MNGILRQVLPPKMRGVLRDSVTMLKYATPDPFFQYGRMSDTANGWYETFRRDGIIKIEDNADFVAVADYIEKTYFEFMEREGNSVFRNGPLAFPWNDSRFVQDSNKERYRSGGTEISCSISFRDPGCAPLLLNPDLIAMLCAYYGRQPYYRNQPLVQKISFRGDNIIDNGQIHVDHLHQVSFMLLVSDVTDAHTHMKYCVGSHRRNVLKQGILMPLDKCKDLSEGYSVLDCTGKKGTLFVFDAGGFHRANYMANSSRKMLHCNITTGHHLGQFVDKKDGWQQLSEQPQFVKQMFKFLE